MMLSRSERFGVFAHAQHIGQGAFDQQRVGERGDLHGPDPIGEVIQQLFTGGQGQTRCQPHPDR